MHPMMAFNEGIFEQIFIEGISTVTRRKLKSPKSNIKGHQPTPNHGITNQRQLGAIIKIRYPCLVMTAEQIQNGLGLGP
jgi:hypothetical protein